MGAGTGAEVEGCTGPDVEVGVSLSAAAMPATEIPTDSTVSATQPVYAAQGITSHRS